MHQTDLFLAMVAEYNRTHPGPLLQTSGSDDHNQPGEGLVLGCGRDNNLRPACGRYAVVEALEERARRLQSPVV